jgi:hypothetical protein
LDIIPDVFEKNSGYNPKMSKINNPLFILGSILFFLGFFLLAFGFGIQCQNILAFVVSAEFTDMVRQDRFFAFGAGGQLPML